MCSRIRGVGLLVDRLCRFSPAPNPSNSKKENRQTLAIFSFQVYLLHSWHPAANEGHPHLARGSYTSVRCDKASRAEIQALVVSPETWSLRCCRRADLQLPSGRLKLPVSQSGLKLLSS